MITLLFASCGEESSTPPYIPNDIKESCKDALARTRSDYDGDGIADFDELYGWKVQVDGKIETVYTNPLVMDTDGDGRSDLAEQATTSILGRAETSAAVAQMHPAHKDYIVRVYAGLSEGKGFLNGQPTSQHNTGWNIFEAIKVKTDDTLQIRDLKTERWRSSLGPSSATGISLDYPCPNITTTCLVANENSLIGKTAKTTDVTGIASYPFEIGTKFEGALRIFERLIAPDQNDRILMLRSNNIDGSYLQNSSGYISLSVRVVSNSDYPQRVPTAEEERKSLQTICPEEK